MNKKLYVGNLPYSISEEELKTAFGQYGSVLSARIIMDKMSGRSKGFAFIEMGTDEEAQKALQGMNGKEIGGRKLMVSEARPEQPRSPGGPSMAPRPFSNGRGGGGGYGDRPPPRDDRRDDRPRPSFRDNAYNAPMDPPQNTKRDSKDRRHVSSDDDDDDNRGNR